MIIKRICALLACLAAMSSLLLVPASALESGAYTAGVITTYYNPDTGEVDDFGTANAALGEGMCRSATDTTALVEVDSDGKTWLTIRLLLQSSCKTPAFSTRTDYDSYTSVAYTVTAEDAASDSADYRMPVSGSDAILKVTMYVTPMGRDVLWYLYLDTATLSAGSGDFVVNVDTSASPSEQEGSTSVVTPVPATTPASAATPIPTLVSTDTTQAPTQEEPENIPALVEEQVPAGTKGLEEAVMPDESTPVGPVEISTPQPEVVPVATPESIVADQGEEAGAGTGVVVAAVIAIALVVVLALRGKKRT